MLTERNSCLMEQHLKQHDGYVTDATSTNIALVTKRDSNHLAGQSIAPGSKKGRKVFDKKKVCCYSCNKFGHFA